MTSDDKLMAIFAVAVFGATAAPASVWALPCAAVAIIAIVLAKPNNGDTHE